MLKGPMSVDIQKQIRDNSTSVSDYFSDLQKWTAGINKEEDRREVRKARKRGELVAPIVREVKEDKKPKFRPDHEEDKATTKEEQAQPLERDKQPMAQYYTNWDQYDVDAEVEKIEDAAWEADRRELNERQAVKDKILDDLALTADGDRSRTTKARPRVKVAVRASGRRASPVDLAAPRKDEANRYFAEGRFREAIAVYSIAIEGLEKYQPPEQAPAPAEADGGLEGADLPRPGDCAGEETEAINMKVALLGNRALAYLKLEEYRDCVEDCSEALRFDPVNHKAILRRGFAYARQKRWARAARDLTQAVTNDPKDKKASAELQMVQRKLAEHLKEDRAHARCMICDTTRNPSMPTRRLAVKPLRAGEAPGAAPAPTVREPPPRPSITEDSGAPVEKVAPAAAQARKPYVPRSVRVRGWQAPGAPPPSVQASSGSSAARPPEAAAVGSMNFYTFETQWMKLRSSTHERAALLQRVGAGNLPALFRESFDTELLVSILEVLAAEVAADGSRAGFAGDVLEGLSRTQRFDVSLKGLSVDERRSCDELLERLTSTGARDGAAHAALRHAYEPPPLVHADTEEDEVREARPVRPAPSTPTTTLSGGDASMESTAKAPAANAPAVDDSAPGGDTFSLDDCD